MNPRQTRKTDANPKPPKRRGSRIYFSPASERKCFFIMTLLMLMLGVLARLGWL